MNNNDRFDVLWTDYLEGELNETHFEELQQMLRHNSDLRVEARRMYQLHRMLGLLEGPNAHDQFVSDTMKRIPLVADRFVENVLRRIDSIEQTQVSQTVVLIRKPREYLGWLVAVAASIAFISWIAWDRIQLDVLPSIKPQTTEPTQEVLFASTARVKFLGEFSPLPGSTVAQQRDYILNSGSVQLQFPSGAQAILEAPAVFQILSTEKLRLSVGRCSVHAPKGAEGFSVETPTAMIVDRGTRFAVSVSETAKTELHVIEGAADLYRQSTDNSISERLVEREARSVDGSPQQGSSVPTFDPKLFRARLPDRVLSYQATESNLPSGGVQDLIRLQVQRGGIAKDYRADELTLCDLIWFSIEEIIIDDTGNRIRHLASNSSELNDRREAVSDLALNTGAINPGGSIQPTSMDPVMDDSRPDRPATPGFAVRFRKPVVNRDGPDVVFFELQDLPGAPDGDSFHVIPMKFRTGLTPITIKSYDLTLTSPESLKLAPFYLHAYQEAVQSLNVFRYGECKTTETAQFGSNYRAVCVGIDLTAMGYRDGESISELFFQDALDDRKHVDPVLIVGLP